MRLALRLHPDSRSAAVTQIEVDVLRPKPGDLVLRYVVTGKIADLALPPVAAPARTDELWRHICFEAFVRGETGEAYEEFNFAPSTQWAAYRFSDYREGMSANDVAPPRIEVQAGAERYELQAMLDIAPDRAWRLALSAVIEEKSGEKSYWALAHAPGKPDFHHADSFAFELPAVEQT